MADDEDFGLVLSEDDEDVEDSTKSQKADFSKIPAMEGFKNSRENVTGVALTASISADKCKLSLDPVFEVVKVPEKCRNGVPCCVGIDEAGRGPVIGSMVYGAAYWPIDENDNISKLGFNDSKKLTEADRERMFSVIEKELNSRIGIALCDLSAEYISTRMMLRQPVSLNEMSYQAAIGMLQRIIAAGVNVTEIYVDAVGNCERYEQRLRCEFPDASVVVKPKADAIYKVVGAASICAKVTRDRSLKTWVFREHFDVTGKPLPNALRFSELKCSGYPGDQKTKDWLLKNSDPVFGFPSVVRHSWRTTRNLYGEDDPELTSSEKREKKRERDEQEQKEQRAPFFEVEWENLEEVNPSAAPKLMTFMQAVKRNKFFQERRLHHVSSF